MHRRHHKLDGSGSTCGAVPRSGSGSGSKGAKEESLFYQAQAGCRDSLNRLVERHDGLVHAVVRRQVLGDLPYAEALQAGRIGLWRAILGFDSTLGYAFSTYAWPSIVHPIWRAVKLETRACDAAQSEVGDEWCAQWWWEACLDPAVQHSARCIVRTLRTLVSHLPQRLQVVVVARYGLDGGGRRLYREIGAALGVSGERARQLHNEALVWLRHPARSQRLRCWLDRHALSDYQWAEAEAQRWLRKRGGRHGRR